MFNAEDETFLAIAAIQLGVMVFGSLFFFYAENTVTKWIIVTLVLAVLAGIMWVIGCL